MSSSACPFTREVDSVMSNWDREIDRTVEAYLKAEPCWSHYPGWNFSGRVWWDRDLDKWKCEVRVLHVVREIVEADTLDDIMKDVSDKYGWD